MNVDLRALLDSIEDLQEQFEFIAAQLRQEVPDDPEGDDEVVIIDPPPGNAPDEDGAVVLSEYTDYVAQKKARYYNKPSVVAAIEEKKFDRFLWHDMPHLTEEQRRMVQANGDSSQSWFKRLFAGSKPGWQIRKFKRIARFNPNSDTDIEIPRTAVLYDNTFTVTPGNKAYDKRVPWDKGRVLGEAKTHLDRRIQDALNALVQIEGQRRG